MLFVIAQKVCVIEIKGYATDLATWGANEVQRSPGLGREHALAFDNLPADDAPGRQNRIYCLRNEGMERFSLHF